MSMQLFNRQIWIDPELNLKKAKHVNIDLSKAYLIFYHLDFLRGGLIILGTKAHRKCASTTNTFIPLTFNQIAIE